MFKNRQALAPRFPFIFDFSDPKLRDLANCLFFQTDNDEIEFKKLAMTSFQ